MPAAAAASKRPRRKSRLTIGPRSAISPAIAGTVMKKSSRSAYEKSSRSRPVSPRAACSESAGSTAMPIATPKMPIGNWISRIA